MRLWLHASSVWPANIDFDLLNAYAAGFSVKETVEQILAAHASRASNGNKKRTCANLIPFASGVTMAENLVRQQFSGNVSSFCLAHSSFDYCTPTEAGLTLKEASKKGGDGEDEEKKFSETCNDDPGRGSPETLRRRNTNFNGFTPPFYWGPNVPVPSEVGTKKEFLSVEVEEQFNFFDMLRENYLSTPYVFLSSYAIPIAMKERRRVVEIFYSVDEELLEAYFGERLHKFALDDKSEDRFFGKSRGKCNQKMQKLMQSEIKEGSLRRQWENLKLVCTFLASAYRGRDGLLIPCTMPLLKALEQCFSLYGELGMRYGAFVFGFEHRLTGRVWERLLYTERATLCFALASMWCDDSQLMLREMFCKVCTRIARLLDENRVVAEMHQLMFGEAMRPRWQVQLNGVHRAIYSNTGVGSSGCQHMSTFIKSPLPSSGKAIPHVLLPRNTSTRTLDISTNLGATTTTTTMATQSALTKAQCSSENLSQQPIEVQQSTTTGLGNSVSFSGSSSSALNATITTNNNSSCAQTSCVMSEMQNSTLHGNSVFSANGAFTRDFLLEFPFIIKCLSRVALTIGSSGMLHEALEMFYTRVYLHLENMGCRVFCNSNTEANKMLRENWSHPLEALAETETMRENLCSATGRGNEKFKAMTDGAVKEDHDDDDEADHVSCLLKGNRSGDVQKSTTTSTGVLGSAVVVDLPPSAKLGHLVQQFSTPASPNSSQPVNQNTACCAIGTVNNQMFLFELCVFLNLLSNIFCRLTTLMEEDHMVCDQDFSNFVLALKFLTQIHMASDGH